MYLMAIYLIILMIDKISNLMIDKISNLMIDFSLFIEIVTNIYKIIPGIK
jgi:hypothetical protein